MEDKKILITGGTGSFGSAMVKYLLKTDVKKIYVFSRDELKQFEMKQKIKSDRVSFLIGDIRDYQRLEMAFSGIDYVIHAAALKQVESCEYNPIEAVNTNILGAENIIKAAIKNKVKKVIALSTDKAVEPVNLYGATKCTMEKLFISGNAYAGGLTKFSVVRYGNVIGSRGSVIPLWLKLFKEGKSIPVTDKRMTRFVLTLNNAVKFVHLSLLNMHGAETFIPFIPSVSIYSIANVISSDITLIGIKPGEKLHESLISALETGDIYLYKNGDMPFYIIYPKFSWFNNTIPNNLIKIENGKEYSSKDFLNLSKDDIKGIIDGQL